MIAWEIKSRECHIFDIPLLACVIFPCLNHCEIPLRKQNEIFRIDVTVAALFVALTSFVQLRLQIGPRIVRGIVLGVWYIAPSRSQL